MKDLNHSFYIKQFWDGAWAECKYCGVRFRIQLNKICYNYDRLDYCPYCTTYAFDDQIPEWIFVYQKIICLRERDILYG